MTAVDVDALDKLREAATAGPWGLDFNEWMDGSRIASMTSDQEITGEIHWNDAVLISAMHTALPDILAEVRRGRALRERHDELRHRLKALVDEWDAMARNLHHIPVAEAYADVVIGLRAVVVAVDGGEQS